MDVKQTTLRTSFWKFLAILLLGLILSVAIPLGLLSIGTGTGVISYADYSERMTRHIAPVLAASPNLHDVELPMGCEYVLLDKNYNLIETSLEGDDLDRAMDYALYGKINTDLKKQYLLVTRDKEYVVLQYYIGSQFTRPLLYKHLPSPEILLYVLIGFNVLGLCLVLIGHFAKSMKKQLNPLLEATQEISRQNLDFEVGQSDIAEFQEILTSFSDMKNNLQASYEKEWAMEQAKRDQITSLAHDLKTPLTIIQGNVDLLAETPLNEEQGLYTSYIETASEQIRSYVDTLMDIARTSDSYPLRLEIFSADKFMEELRTRAESLCLAKGIGLNTDIKPNLDLIKADKALLERALLNVIHNALDFSPPDQTIRIMARTNAKHLEVIVKDRGPGFSSEALKHAKEQFFTGDKSRTSDSHYGMGLFITQTLIQKHGGQVSLKNADDGPGAEVLIRIPLEV